MRASEEVAQAQRGKEAEAEGLSAELLFFERFLWEETGRETEIEAEGEEERFFRFSLPLPLFAETE